MKGLDGKLMIVTASPGTRDTIYVGYCERKGDLLCLSQASMIVRYEQVGVSGLATQPDRATRLRPATGTEGRVWIPLSSVAAMVEADPQAWADHLGVSRG